MSTSSSDVKSTGKSSPTTPQRPKMSWKIVLVIVIALLLVVGIIIATVMFIKHDGSNKNETDSEISTEISAQTALTDSAIPQHTVKIRGEDWDDGSFEDSRETIYDREHIDYDFKELGVEGIRMQGYKHPEAFYPPQPKKKFHRMAKSQIVKPATSYPTSGYRNVEGEQFIEDTLKQGFSVRSRNHISYSCSFAALGSEKYSAKVYNKLMQDCRNQATVPGYKGSLTSLWESDGTTIPLAISMATDTAGRKLHVHDDANELSRNYRVFIGQGSRYFHQATVKQNCVAIDVNVTAHKSGSSWKITYLSWSDAEGFECTAELWNGDLRGGRA